MALANPRRRRRRKEYLTQVELARASVYIRSLDSGIHIINGAGGCGSSTVEEQEEWEEELLSDFYASASGIYAIWHSLPGNKM